MTRVWHSSLLCLCSVLFSVLFSVLCTGEASARSGTCDDGNPCTVDEFIRGLGCVSRALPGCQPCQQDADCPDPDGDLCTGTFYCDSAAGVCALNPATVVTCPDESDDPCVAYRCQPETGACALQPMPGGTPCDDGLPCTVGDACEAGVCVGKGDVCACQSDGDCADDGNLCNGTPYCDKSVFPYACAVNPASVVSCNSAEDTACRVSQCAPATGLCSLQAIEGSCDDGDPCTLDDACLAGSCQGRPDYGAQAACQCGTDADCAAFEDGNACNGTLFCNLASHTCELNPATLITCPSVGDTACRQNQCDPATGQCRYQDRSALCDDGDPCTVDDACVEGTCQGSASVGADGVCECEVDADCALFDDGDLCNGTLYCDAARHACVLNPATVIEPGLSCMTDADCPAGFPCVGEIATVDEWGRPFARAGRCSLCADAAAGECRAAHCQPSTGLCVEVEVPVGTPCSGDGDVCTLLDQCRAGSCSGTLDLGIGATCECRTDAECADDGDLCNGTPYCDLSTHRCEINPATVVHCASTDESACQENRCDPASGTCQLQPRADASACDDQDPCTVSDRCLAGVCGGDDTCACRRDSDCLDDDDRCNGTPYCDRSEFPWQCRVNPATRVRCVDDNPDDCQLPVCQPAIGRCVAAPAPDGTLCADGAQCTGEDRCRGGLCEGTPVCPTQALCQVSLEGSTECVCAPGYGGASCDVPLTPDAGTPGACEGASPPLSACLRQPGEECLSGQQSVDLACGDDTGFVDSMGCDVERGCIAGLGACDPAAFTPTCEGTRRVAGCSVWGQKHTLDCTSPTIGARACEGPGICVGIPVGMPCFEHALRCVDGARCEVQDASGIGICTANPAEPPSACAAPATWLGDGYCDATANLSSCAWDLGDCCPTTCVSAAYPCGAVGYDCRDPDVSLENASDAGAGENEGDCAAQADWLGDGYCDATANTPECEWDRGDCCSTTCMSAAYPCGTVGYDCRDPGAPPEVGPPDAGANVEGPDASVISDAAVPEAGRPDGELRDGGARGTDAAVPWDDAGTWPDAGQDAGRDAGRDATVGDAGEEDGASRPPAAEQTESPRSGVALLRCRCAHGGEGAPWTLWAALGGLAVLCRHRRRRAILATPGRPVVSGTAGSQPSLPVM